MGLILKDNEFLFGTLDIEKCTLRDDLFIINFQKDILNKATALVSGAFLFIVSLLILFINLPFLFKFLLLPFTCALIALCYGVFLKKGSVTLDKLQKRVVINLWFMSNRDRIVDLKKDAIFDVRLDKGNLKFVVENGTDTVVLFAQDKFSLYKIRNTLPRFLFDLKLFIMSSDVRAGENFNKLCHITKVI